MQRFSLIQACFLVSLLVISSCHMRQVAAPVPAVSGPAAAAAPAPVPASAPAASESPAPPSDAQQNPPVPAPKKPTRSAASSNPAPTPAATPAPKLSDVLTSDQQKQYSASIDQSLSRAQDSLNRVSGRPLNKDQQAELQQIQNFMKQARATRNSDPAGARSLAERAEILAHDLAASFR
jgi:hypothetical protein